MQFLIDTGSNTNLLAKHMFDRLPKRVRDTVEECDSHGVMADGTKMQFYGILQTPGRIRDVKFEGTFVISCLSEDAILGMTFLLEQGCTLNFGNPVISIQGQELACTDRFGRLLTSKVQALKTITVAPGSEVTLTGRVTAHNRYPLGIVEGQPRELPLATSLNKPNEKGHVLVRCLNPH